MCRTSIVLQLSAAAVDQDDDAGIDGDVDHDDSVDDNDDADETLIL